MAAGKQLFSNPMQNSKKNCYFSSFFFFSSSLLLLLFVFALAAVHVKGHTGHTLAEYDYTAIIIGS